MKYGVCLYYTGIAYYEVEAENEEVAIEAAKELNNEPSTAHDIEFDERYPERDTAEEL